MSIGKKYCLSEIVKYPLIIDMQLEFSFVLRVLIYSELRREHVKVNTDNIAGFGNNSFQENEFQ